MKEKSFISIALGILSLLWYPFLTIDVFENWMSEIAGRYHLYTYDIMISGFVFVLFAIAGIIFGTKGRKSEGKLLATIGIILSVLGLVITIGITSLIYLIGYFWGG